MGATRRLAPAPAATRCAEGWRRCPPAERSSARAGGRIPAGRSSRVQAGGRGGERLSDPRLERLFRENFAVIQARCTRMLGEREEAADVAQETFARLCESGAVHDDPALRVRWIWRTSTRIAIDVLRRRRQGVETRQAAPD